MFLAPHSVCRLQTTFLSLPRSWPGCCAQLRSVGREWKCCGDFRARRPSPMAGQWLARTHSPLECFMGEKLAFSLLKQRLFDSLNPHPHEYRGYPGAHQGDGRLEKPWLERGRYSRGLGGVPAKTGSQEGVSSIFLSLPPLASVLRALHAAGVARRSCKL